MNVISIQSQVAFGHVGNSAAVFPMQMHGIDVVDVPTMPSWSPISCSASRSAARSIALT
jgi:pyridoxal/pyridoxine/pyridoxamine kinase